MRLDFLFSRKQQGDTRALEAILHQEAKSHNLVSQVLLTPVQYHFIVQGSEESLLKFSQSIALALPISLFFTFECVEKLEDSAESLAAPHDEIPTRAETEFTPAQMSAYLQSIKESCYAPKLPCDLHFTLAGESVDSLELYDAFRALALAIKEGESVELDSRLGRIILAREVSKLPHICQNELYFMPLDVANVETIFRVTKEELEILATWEKPCVKLAFKGIFAEQFAPFLRAQASVNVRLPYDVPLVILAHFLALLEVEMVVFAPFFAQSEAQEGKEKRVKTYAMDYPVHAPLLPLFACVTPRVAVLGRQGEQPMGSYAELLERLCAEYSLQNTLALHVSEHNPTQFWLLKEGETRRVMNFACELNPALIFEQIAQSDEGAQRLVENFSAQFPEIVQRIKSASPKQNSGNLSNWIAMAGFFSALGGEFDLPALHEAVLRGAQGFLGSKGPRIDFVLRRGESGNIELDYLRVLRSCMSFKLAGIDDETLSFGIIDSYAEFFGKLIGDMSENFALHSVVLSGSMMIQKPFLSRLVSYIPSPIALATPFLSPLEFRA